MTSPDEAGGAPHSRPSVRSCSASRRGVTPREYVVEVLTQAQARELVEGTPRSTDSPNCASSQSPALLLCPGETDSTECCSPSISSDEGDIRDRLRQSLQEAKQQPQVFRIDASPSPRFSPRSQPHTVWASHGALAAPSPRAPANTPRPLAKSYSPKRNERRRGPLTPQRYAPVLSQRSLGTGSQADQRGQISRQVSRR